MHGKIKDFACHTCEYVATTSPHLKRYEKIKDYACHNCEFATAYPGELKRHVKVVHEKIKECA